jgi:hypothetical protein
MVRPAPAWPARPSALGGGSAVGFRLPAAASGERWRAAGRRARLTGWARPSSIGAGYPGAPAGWEGFKTRSAKGEPRNEGFVSEFGGVFVGAYIRAKDRDPENLLSERGLPFSSAQVALRKPSHGCLKNFTRVDHQFVISSEYYEIPSRNGRARTRCSAKGRGGGRAGASPLLRQW